MDRLRIAQADGTTSEVCQYLPQNYSVIGLALTIGEGVIIAGRDNHGWTLHEYVIPRLASGLIVCVELDVSLTILRRTKAPANPTGLHNQRSWAKVLKHGPGNEVQLANAVDDHEPPQRLAAQHLDNLAFIRYCVRLGWLE